MPLLIASTKLFIAADQAVLVGYLVLVAL